MGFPSGLTGHAEVRQSSRLLFRRCLQVVSILVLAEESDGDGLRLLSMEVFETSGIRMNLKVLRQGWFQFCKQCDHLTASLARCLPVKWNGLKMGSSFQDSVKKPTAMSRPNRMMSLRSNLTPEPLCPSRKARGLFLTTAPVHASSKPRPGCRGGSHRG